MKKVELKNIIKENIIRILKEEGEEDTPTKVTIPSELIKLIKDLGVTENIPAITSAIALVAKGEESKLNMTQNEYLAKVFIALLKNSDVNKSNKFISLTKRIE
jgi:hypothetical protein